MAEVNFIKKTNFPNKYYLHLAKLFSQFHWSLEQAPIVGKVDKTVDRINHYPVDDSMISIVKPKLISWPV